MKSVTTFAVALLSIMGSAQARAIRSPDEVTTGIVQRATPAHFWLKATGTYHLYSKGVWLAHDGFAFQWTSEKNNNTPIFQLTADKHLTVGDGSRLVALDPEDGDDIITAATANDIATNKYVALTCSLHPSSLEVSCYHFDAEKKRIRAHLQICDASTEFTLSGQVPKGCHRVHFTAVST